MMPPERDERPADLEALFCSMRTLRPPPGARERVLARIEGTAARRPTRLRYAALTVAAATAASLLVAFWLHGRSTPVARVLGASGAHAEARPIREGDGLGSVAVEVNDGGRLHLAFALGEVEIRGGSRATLGRRGFRLTMGQVTVRGTVEVQGDGCAALIRGRSTITVVEHGLVVAMDEGTMEPVPPAPVCQKAPATPHTASAPATMDAASEPARGVARAAETAAAPPGGPAKAAATRELPSRAHGSKGHGHRALPEDGSGDSRPPTSPSELAQEAQAYQNARILRGRDDLEALARWRAMKARWPSGALAHEVDINIVDTLVRLGRADEAQAAARDFLRRHPRSAKAAEMRRIVGPETSGR
jgi:hypothetical protein